MYHEPPSPPPQQLPERWYLPTWTERLRLMGWRIIYFIPALIILALLALAPWMVFWWWKLIIIVVGLPMGVAIRTAAHAVRLRKEPFCIHCGYDLTGLPDGHTCPECGHPFSHAEIDDYRRDPHWFIKRQTLNRNLPNPGAPIDAGPQPATPAKRRRDGT